MDKTKNWMKLEDILIPVSTLIEDLFAREANKLLQKAFEELKWIKGTIQDVENLLACVEDILNNVKLWIEKKLHQLTANDGPEIERLLVKLISEQLRLLAETKEFCKIYPVWSGIRTNTLKELKDIADHLDSFQSTIDYTKAAGNVGGLVSGGLAMAGIGLTPITGGMSLCYMIGAASTATGLGANISLSTNEYAMLDRVKKAVMDDSKQTQELYKTLERFHELIENSLEINNRLQIRIIKYYKPGLRLPISLGLAGLKRTTLHGLLYHVEVRRHTTTIAKETTNSAAAETKKEACKTKEIRKLTPEGKVLVGIGMAVDFVELQFTLANIKAGSKSNLANRLRQEIINVLEIEKQAMEEYRYRLKRDEEIIAKLQ